MHIVVALAAASWSRQTEVSGVELEVRVFTTAQRRTWFAPSLAVDACNCIVTIYSSLLLSFAATLSWWCATVVPPARCEPIRSSFLPCVSQYVASEPDEERDESS